MSCSHFQELIRIDRKEEREFYQLETIKSNLGYRKLGRQINTKLYDRYLISPDKQFIIEDSKKGLIKKQLEVEFAGSKENRNYLESNLEKFINNEDINVPDLVKIAMIHYQFESIHPFLDGNGRTGRILIPIYLLSKGIINKPCFYISDYIEKNKEAYYDFLSRVRTNNDMIAWIKFFLEATIETAKITRIKFENIIKLTNEMNNKIMELPIKPENSKKVIDLLYN